MHPLGPELLLFYFYLFFPRGAWVGLSGWPPLHTGARDGKGIGVWRGTEDSQLVPDSHKGLKAGSYPPWSVWPQKV